MTTLDAKETAETKGDGAREDAHDILQAHARPTRGWPAADLTRRDAPCGQRPAMRLEV